MIIIIYYIIIIRPMFKTLVTTNSSFDCLINFSLLCFLCPCSTPRPSPHLPLLFPLLSHQLRLIPSLTSVLRHALEPPSQPREVPDLRPLRVLLFIKGHLGGLARHQRLAHPDHNVMTLSGPYTPPRAPYCTSALSAIGSCFLCWHGVDRCLL